MRLTERCADILLSVRQEISKAGNEVGPELTAPIAKLEEYVYIHVFISGLSYLDGVQVVRLCR